MSNCLSRIIKSTKERGLNLSEERLQEITALMEKERAQDLTKTEFKAKLDSFIQDEIVGLQEKINAAQLITLAARENAVKTIMTKVEGGGSLKNNLLSWAGGGSVRKGDSVNIDPKQIAKVQEARALVTYQKGLGELKTIAEKGTLDREVLQELSAIQNGLPHGKSGSRDAVKIAQAIHEAEIQQFDLKKAYNPFLEQIGDYLVKQTHNRIPIRDAGKEQWISDIYPLIQKKSLPNMTPDQKIEYLGDLWERIASGTYGTVLDDSRADKFIGGQGMNLQKQMARQRVLLFESPDAFYKYNLKYGFGTVDQAVRSMIRKSATQIAQLEKFGANPERMKDDVFARVVAMAPEAERQEIKDSRGALEKVFRTAMGYTDVPARGVWARRVQNVLSVGYASMTGGAYLHSLPDIAIAASAVRDLDGKNIFQNSAELTAAYSKFFASTDARREGLAALGMFAREVHGSLLDSLGASTQEPGIISKITEGMTTLNGLLRHDEAMRAATGTVLANKIASMADMAHPDLPKSWRDGLLRYGIGEHEWEAMRLADKNQKTGFIDSDAIEALPDNVVQKYLKASGQSEGPASDQALDLARYRLSQKLGVMINDHADMSSMKLNTRQRAFLYQGESINSGLGIALRMFGQFKSAAYNIFQVYQRAYFNGETPTGKWAAVAGTAAMSTFFWAIGDYIDQTLQGKTPEDPTSPDFIRRAVAGSGMAWIYGDLLLGESDRNGVADIKGAMLAKTAGPTISNLYSLGAIGVQYAKALGGDARAPNKELASFVISQLPFQNLSYAKGALNFYFFNGLKEFLSSGYLGHLEEHLTKQTPGLLSDEHRSYFMFRPTESPAWPREVLQ